MIGQIVPKLQQNIVEILNEAKKSPGSVHTDKSQQKVDKYPITPISVSHLFPGDVLLFEYKDKKYRLVLVVKTKRTFGTAFMVSARGSILLSCFKLDNLSPEVAGIIFNNLYKKERQADYYSKITKGLTRILGNFSYRTYNTNSLRGLRKIRL